MLVRSLIREVVGFAPYEKRCLEMLRNDFDKKALKYAKRRVCSACVQSFCVYVFVCCFLLFLLVVPVRPMTSDSSGHHDGVCVCVQLGTHFRAKKKREELQEIIRARRAAALKKEAKEKK